MRGGGKGERAAKKGQNTSTCVDEMDEGSDFPELRGYRKRWAKQDTGSCGSSQVGGALLGDELQDGCNSQVDTSSTAQGGGGSFKNRKPIGEVGCCESGMAKRIH
jgi:hypothetical protein